MNLQSHFGYNKKVRNGIFLLLSLIIIAQFVIIFYSEIFPKNKIVNTKQSLEISIFEKKIDSLKKIKLVYKKKYYTKKYYKNNNYPKYNKTPKYKKQIVVNSKFDPNKLTKKGWINLGFSPKQANSILKYKNMLHGFKTKNDIKKSFVISDKKYLEIQKFIVFGAKNKTIKYKNIQTKKETLPNEIKEKTTKFIHKIDLNIAKPEDLIKIYGIGEVLSKRIVKFRNILGGFVSKKQLTQVYGLKPEVVSKILVNFTINKQNIIKINVNTADFRTLIRHPYINKSQTIKILDFREENSDISDINELVDNKIFSKQEFEKIKLYLSVK